MKHKGSIRHKQVLKYLFLGLIISFVSGRANADPPVVLSDNRLIELANDTYLRGDWIYAVAHMNALIQRNPPAVRNNAKFAEELGQGIAHAVQQLQTIQGRADACKPTQTQTSGGVGGVQAGLGSAAPEIHFPKYK